jgi:hypothetical protein
VDASATLPGDLHGLIARAVVDEQQVDRKPARLRRNPGDDRTDGGLLVAGNDDGKTAPDRSLHRPRTRRLHGECPAWDPHT